MQSRIRLDSDPPEQLTVDSKVYSLLAGSNGSTLLDAFVDDDKDVDQTRINGKTMTLKQWQN